MTTEPLPPAPTQQALRERIHRLFGDDGPAVPPVVPPRFWVGPSEEHKNTLHLDIHEQVELGDEVAIRSEKQSRETQWLNAPHVGLDGRSPEAMLTGDDGSRQRLCVFVAAIEASLRQGSFS